MVKRYVLTGRLVKPCSSFRADRLEAGIARETFETLALIFTSSAEAVPIPTAYRRGVCGTVMSRTSGNVHRSRIIRCTVSVTAIWDIPASPLAIRLDVPRVARAQPCGEITKTTVIAAAHTHTERNKQQKEKQIIFIK